VLYRGGHWRSATSRAYYALFSAITFRLPAAAIPPRHTSPRHRDLQALIDVHFATMPWHRRAAIKAAVARAYASRLAADYRPAVVVDRATAKQALNDAAGVLRRMGV
jgi:uncharacterized protein (UPF0332 family)